jgi:hypothetical protein
MKTSVAMKAAIKMRMNKIYRNSQMKRMKVQNRMSLKKAVQSSMKMNQLSTTNPTNKKSHLLT